MSEEVFNKIPEKMEADSKTNIKFEFTSATEILKKSEDFEDQLKKAKDEKQEELALQIYNDYLEMELKGGDPVRLKTLFEKRIAEHCSCVNCWLEYAEYLEKNGKMNQAHEVLSRSVINRPCSGILWVKFLRSCEKLNSPLEVITGHVKLALATGNTSIYYDVWMAFIDYRRREMKLDELKDKTKRATKIDEFRKLFTNALDHLAQVSGDPEYKIARYWASLEANQFQSKDKARQIWSESIMSINSPARDQAKFWIEYINLEKMSFGGDNKHLRKLFSRALEQTKDWPEQVGENWILFEREAGDLESLEKAENHVNSRMKEIELQRTSSGQQERLKKRTNFKNKVTGFFNGNMYMNNLTLGNQATSCSGSTPNLSLCQNLVPLDKHITKNGTRLIALVAHNNMKPSMLRFVTKHVSFFKQVQIVTTGSTGAALEKALNLKIAHKVASGPLGGDQQIGAMITQDEVAGAFFFVDPLTAHPHEADINALTRICEVHNCALATNPISGEALVHAFQTSLVHIALLEKVEIPHGHEQGLGRVEKTHLKKMSSVVAVYLDQQAAIVSSSKK